MLELIPLKKWTFPFPTQSYYQQMYCAGRGYFCQEGGFEPKGFFQVFSQLLFKISFVCFKYCVVIISEYLKKSYNKINHWPWARLVPKVIFFRKSQVKSPKSHDFDFFQIPKKVKVMTLTWLLLWLFSFFLYFMVPKAINPSFVDSYPIFLKFWVSM